MVARNLDENSFLDSTAPVRPGEELDLARLEPYLRSRFPRESGPLIVEQFPQGHSNLTYLVRLGDRELALRCPPFGSEVKTAHDMGREYRVLSKLHKAYSPAPRPFFFCEDESVLGAPFYGMERVRGVILRKDLPPGLEIQPDTARRMSESFIDNLTVLHGLDFEEVGLGDLGKPEGYVARQISGWIKRYARSRTHELEGVKEISLWLTEKMPSEAGSALIHNDYKYDNVVLDPADLTHIIGVLDWEMCTLGDPLMDLGTALNYWVNADDPDELQQIRLGLSTLPGTLSRSQLAERYAEKSGQDISDLAYYYAFGLFKTAVICQQIYYRYHHGLTRDERFPAFLDATRILIQAAVRVAKTGIV